jgi:Na+-driven multidrug efflux pump
VWLAWHSFKQAGRTRLGEQLGQRSLPLVEEHSYIAFMAIHIIASLVIES